MTGVQTCALPISFGRNKDGEIIAGFYAGRTHDIIGNDDCLLGVEENQEILGIIKGFMEENGLEPYDEYAHKGLVRHVLIRKGFKTGELMVCLVINGKFCLFFQFIALRYYFKQTQQIW